MAWLKEQENGKVQGIHMMAVSKNKGGRFQAKQIARDTDEMVLRIQVSKTKKSRCQISRHTGGKILRNLDGKVQEIQMARFKNPDGKVQEIQMARFKNPDGKVQEIQMARFKKYRWQGQEIQMSMFKKSRWQGSRNTTAELPLCLPA